MINLPDRSELEPGTVHDGWYIVPRESEMERFGSVGGLAYLREGYPIPVHHATTPAGTLEVIRHYQTIADQIGSLCLFRGQNRDVFQGPHLTVDPPAMRSGVRSPFARSTSRKEVSRVLEPWLRFLAKRGIDLGDCLQYQTIEDDLKGHEYGVLRLFDPGDLTGRRSSLAILGIMQHYGFPTYCLDVSAEPQVSMWFALHRFEPDAAGALRASPLPARGRPIGSSFQDFADVPALHIYLQPNDLPHLPAFDLRAVFESPDQATRPHLQQAFALPFFCVSRKVAPKGMIETQQDDATRRPSVVIKLYFGALDLLRDFPEVTASKLLPLDDPLYREMKSARLPRLAVYG